MSKLSIEEFELLKDPGYSEKALRLYKEKVNFGVIKNPDVDLAYTGPCGDTLKLYLKISDDGVIEIAKFKYLGCLAVALSGSAITIILQGKTIEEAKKITQQDIIQELRGLPETKLHCSKLAISTLQKTIEKYEIRKNIH